MSKLNVNGFRRGRAGFSAFSALGFFGGRRSVAAGCKAEDADKGKD